MVADEVIVEKTQPPDPSVKVGPGPNGIPGSPPKGYVALSPGENSRAIGKVAASLLGGEWGALTPFRIGEKRYMARVEPHYHPPPPQGADPSKYPKPWGWHKGVTVYKAVATTKVEDVETETKEDKPATGRSLLLQRIDNFLSGFTEKD